MTVSAEELNDPAVLPPHAYRRNHLHYELVGYVNCLIGCRLSGNTADAALFERRIARFMADHVPTGEATRYFELVASYVRSPR